jgi:hypothetical protein
VTVEFAALWDSLPLLAPATPGVCFVLVRGLFGGWIPRHFAYPLQTLERAGLHAIIANTRAVGTVEDNARAIERDVLHRVRPNDRVVFLCHSKGGLDALVALSNSTDLRSRVAAIVLCQVPRGGCAVLESVLMGAYRDSASRGDRMREALARVVLRACSGREGCLDVTGPQIGALVCGIDAARLELPILSVASWSSHPTSWLESQHARLESVRSGCAHDGLFFSEHLVWPVGEQVLLPRVDHSQPGVGGREFDHGRFWLALAHLALRRTELRGSLRQVPGMQVRKRFQGRTRI